MAIVTFESSDGARRVTAEAREGAALADLCDYYAAPIPFSCRSASCATCHIEVLEGETALLPPEDEELDVLDAIGSAPPRFRARVLREGEARDVPIRVRAQNEY